VVVVSGSVAQTSVKLIGKNKEAFEELRSAGLFEISRKYV